MGIFTLAHDNVHPSTAPCLLAPPPLSSPHTRVRKEYISCPALPCPALPNGDKAAQMSPRPLEHLAPERHMLHLGNHLRNCYEA